MWRFPIHPVHLPLLYTVIRPHRGGTALSGDCTIRSVGNGYAVTVPMGDGGRTDVLLNPSPGTVLAAEGLQTSAEVAAVRFGADGTEAKRFVSALP